LLVRNQEAFPLTGNDGFADWADAQRHTRIEIFEEALSLAGSRDRFPFCRYQVQTAGLVRTSRPLWARCAQVTFVNQPDLDTCSAWISHGVFDESLEQILQ
jgi:hypothetical protein